MLLKDFLWALPYAYNCDEKTIALLESVDGQIICNYVHQNLLIRKTVKEKELIQDAKIWSKLVSVKDLFKALNEIDLEPKEEINIFDSPQGIKIYNYQSNKKIIVQSKKGDEYQSTSPLTARLEPDVTFVITKEQFLQLEMLVMLAIREGDGQLYFEVGDRALTVGVSSNGEICQIAINPLDLSCRANNRANFSLPYESIWELLRCAPNLGNKIVFSISLFDSRVKIRDWEIDYVALGFINSDNVMEYPNDLSSEVAIAIDPEPFKDAIAQIVDPQGAYLTNPHGIVMLAVEEGALWVSEPDNSKKLHVCDVDSQDNISICVQGALLLDALEFVSQKQIRLCIDFGLMQIDFGSFRYYLYGVDISPVHENENWFAFDSTPLIQQDQDEAMYEEISALTVEFNSRWRNYKKHQFHVEASHISPMIEKLDNLGNLINLSYSSVNRLDFHLDKASDELLECFDALKKEILSAEEIYETSTSVEPFLDYFPNQLEKLNRTYNRLYWLTSRFLELSQNLNKFWQLLI